MNSIKVTYLRNLNFRSVFVVFRLMKNIILNKIESFVGKNTSDHACQIFCSKSNCETMYHWFFLLEITVVKIMSNLNVCSGHSYLYPHSGLTGKFISETVKDREILSTKRSIRAAMTIHVKIMMKPSGCFPSQ